MELFPFDDDYVNRLRARDPRTEQHFVSYLRPLLVIKLRRRLPTHADVDDVIQTVFTAVYAALEKDHGPRDGRKLGAWVHGIAANVLSEWYRGNRHVSESLDEAKHDLAGDDDVEASFATRETVERVRRVVESMPRRDADLIRAVFLEERPKDEVCRAFGVDREYLRVLLHRARKRFRDEYGGCG